ncbi:MAG: hypothetical protein P1P88_21985, partial [Bacteroidales bacterium]|nr:hypothetical protein [Bacteroidales bacterium]
MKKTHYLFAVFFFQLIVINLFAQQVEINEEKRGEQEFILSAEIRPHLEYYHGYKQLASVDQNHG